MCVYHFFSHPGSHTGLKNCAAEMDWGGQAGACVSVCVCVCVCLSHPGSHTGLKKVIVLSFSFL